jgi:hypothetical protein
MPAWVPMFALPGVEVRTSIEADGVALVSARDDRVQELARRHENFRTYLNCFRNEFAQQIVPSLLIWRDDSNQAYRSAEALSGFRDAVAMSIIPYGWARVLRFGNNFNIRYANAFWFYPWMIDSNWEGIVMQSMNQLGWHEAKALHAQCATGFSHMPIDEMAVDRPLLDALLIHWMRRFSSSAPDWSDTALFRSLNMALSASMLPGNVEVTLYDIGRTISLWVSAFEILAHPGTGVGYTQVYELLEKTKWNLTKCNEAIYEPLGYKQSQPKRSLPIWLYGRLHIARNDFLHGNPIDGSRLIVAPAKRPLHLYPSGLYRMALTSHLDLKMDQQPFKEGQSDYEAYLEYQHNFGHYQRDIEAAISTILYTEDDYRAQRTQIN